MNDMFIPQNLREALRKYSDIYHSMAGDADVREARENIMMATSRLKQAETKLERAELPYRKELDKIKPYIEVNALEVGQTFDYAGLTVKHRRGYERVSLPKANLEKMQEKDPGLYQRIIPYMKVSEVKPTAKLQD